MPKLENLLKRRRDVPADPEIQERLVKRLASLREPFASGSDGAAIEPDPDPSSVQEPQVDDPTALAETYQSLFIGEPPAIDAGDQIDDHAVAALDDPVAPEPGLPNESEPIAAMPAAEPAESSDPIAMIDTPESLAAVGPTEEPELVAPEASGALPLSVDEPAAESIDSVAEAEVPAPKRTRIRLRLPGRQAPAAPAPARPEPPPPVTTAPTPPVTSERVSPAPTRPSRHGSAAAGPAKRPARQPKAAVAVGSCPYCAERLESPPVANVRCPRCRQRIVVRRVGDRFVYLTEAALPVFLAQRRRAAHAGRWTRERDRWLALATASGAPLERVTKVALGVLSDDVVNAARRLYMSTVERIARDARRDRLWEEASRVRFEQAQTVYRIARSPRPVPDDIVQLHRDGLASTLRGLAEIAKSAELRAGTCCDVCRADDGRMVRIAEELRTPTLPHPDCTKGLCRCRWSLADRDRTIVSGLLRRHVRPPRR